jgi:uncharacterized membrane protein required for colicin V production
MEQSLNMFDLVFVGLVGILAFIGLTRGVIREAFSIINICLAAAITVLMRPIISGMLIEKVKLQVVADIISNSIVFTISLVTISLICSGMLKTLSDKLPIYINQPFGFILGFFKGYLIMSAVIITMFSIYEVPSSEQGTAMLPTFITNAKTYNIVKKGADFISPIADKLFENSITSTDSFKDIIQKDSSKESDKKTSEPSKTENKAINFNNRFDREYQQSLEQQKLDNFGYPKKQIRKKNGLVEIFADDEDLIIE